jgi:hypothetical protein
MIGGAITMPANAQLQSDPMDRTVDVRHGDDVDDIDVDRGSVRY